MIYFLNEDVFNLRVNNFKDSFLFFTGKMYMLNLFRTPIARIT